MYTGGLDVMCQWTCTWSISTRLLRVLSVSWVPINQRKPPHESVSQLELCPLYWIILMKTITVKTHQAHKRPTTQDIQVVVKELLKADSLKIESTKRKHSHFPHPRDNLRVKDKGELFQWLIGKLPSTFQFL